MNLLVLVFTWLIYFIPALAVELMCYIFAPLVACFITSRDRYDVVKRLDKRMVVLKRDYIITPLYWFQTHDNAVDEWWYGMYNVDHWFEFARNWTQADYDNSRFIRWYCRVMWMWRNCAYGFLYALFSKPQDIYVGGKTWVKGTEGQGFWVQFDLRPSSFQLEMQVPGIQVFSISLISILLYVGIWQPEQTTVIYLAIFNAALFNLIDKRYLTVNIGWKAHKNILRLLYANRIIGFRKYK